MNFEPLIQINYNSDINNFLQEFQNNFKYPNERLDDQILIQDCPIKVDE